MRTHKRLVICCDGTWNDADNDGRPTNVVRIARAILPLDERMGTGVPQVVYYSAGVGAAGGAVGRLLAGAVGLGLARAVRGAYGFIVDNYRPGDEILLFGFSRGAYTVRSVAGLIGWAGLLRKPDMDAFVRLWDGHRHRPGTPERAAALAAFPRRHARVPIAFMGVWDTVGALGIPGDLDEPVRRRFDFHDTTLGAHVKRACHALALDEVRADFAPTLWEQTPEGAAAGQELRQVWFAGAHADIGDGYAEHGLSDVALAWMAGQVEDLLALDEAYLRQRQDRRAGWGLGRLHDESSRPAFLLRGRSPRRPFAAAARGCEAVHASVVERSRDGAACTPRPYATRAASPALGDLARVAPLTLLERRLRWAAPVPDAAPPEARRA
jgi:uncharacterized protein (DUF2235 family)